MDDNETLKNILSSSEIRMIMEGYMVKFNTKMAMNKPLGLSIPYSALESNILNMYTYLDSLKEILEHISNFSEILIQMESDEDDENKNYNTNNTDRKMPVYAEYNVEEF